MFTAEEERLQEQEKGCEEVASTSNSAKFSKNAHL